MIVHLPHPPRVAYRRIVVAIALLLALAGVFVPTNATARANTAAAPPPCRAADLDAATTHQGMTDATILSILFTVAQPATVCTLSGQPGVRLSDATGAFLVASTPPDLAIGQPVTLSSGSGASISVRWSNWCGARGAAGPPAPISGPIAVLITLPGNGGTLNAHPAGVVAEAGPLDAGPPCIAPDQLTGFYLLGPFSEAPGTTLGPPNSPAYYVAAPFLAYWRTHGGLALLGYPLSRELDVQLEDGKSYRVQYFERARLEYHPENAAPDNILLGQLGRAIHPADPPVPSKNDPFFMYFPETGHNVEKRFLGFWGRGGLAQFGYPLSEEFTERLADGNEYTVQYFERARLEYHPENPPDYRVLLGQLGRRILDERTQRVLVLDPASGPCPTMVTVRGSGFAPGVQVNFLLTRDRDGAVTAGNSLSGGPPAEADGTISRPIPLYGCGPDEPPGSTFTITMSEYRPDSTPIFGPRASATFTVTVP